MTPPVIAQALLAAAAPAGDYDSVAGDLHEEYLHRVPIQGVGAANRWYWAQALASIPPLLSYSRTQRSIWNGLAVGAMVVVSPVVLLLATEAINDTIRVTCGGGHCAAWTYFSADWTDAAVFGALLAFCIRAGGVRLVLVSAVLLVTAIVIPTLLGFSSRLPLTEWLLLFGAVPAMCAGASTYQIIHRRSEN
ncbi:MAG TPA: permease prefix domain 2-containing transporter [Candidatus Baltobacteraceae bacterium]|nr:permease prefix domain 2-containing transporter [Candidatus Baltobacteraceae bacterium]